MIKFNSLNKISAASSFYRMKCYLMGLQLFSYCTGKITDRSQLSLTDLLFLPIPCTPYKYRILISSVIIIRCSVLKYLLIYSYISHVRPWIFTDVLALLSRSCTKSSMYNDNTSTLVSKVTSLWHHSESSHF